MAAVHALPPFELPDDLELLEADEDVMTLYIHDNSSLNIHGLLLSLSGVISFTSDTGTTAWHGRFWNLGSEIALWFYYKGRWPYKEARLFPDGIDTWTAQHRGKRTTLRKLGQLQFNHDTGEWTSM